MATTRLEFVPYLQDATWTIFFTLGFYIRSHHAFALFLITIIVIDFTQIAARGGHQDFYLAPSYLFILPAYFVLWFAGRFFAKSYSIDLKGIALFILTASTGIIMCHLISSGGYYWMSMNVIDLTLNEFIYRTLEYLPLALKINFLYLSIFVLIHLILSRVFKTNQQ